MGAAPGGDTGGGVFSPGRRTLTVGLVLIVTIAAAEALAVATILPLIEADLGDLHLYGWVFSAFFLGNLLGIVTAGRAADRMRPAVPLAIGLGLFGCGLVLGGLAPSMLVLVLARALQGFGAGAMPTIAYVCIGRAYPPPLRPRMFALLSSAWVVPALFGPALAGVVGETVGWRWVFAGLVPLLVVIGVVVIGAVGVLPSPVVDEATRPGGEERPSLLDAVMVAGGAAVVLAGLGAQRWWQATALVVAGAVLALPAFRRLTPEGTLRLRAGLPAAVALRGVLTFAFFSADAYVPLTLTSVRGLSAGVAGLALTGATLTWTTGAWVQERRVHQVGPRRLVTVGFVLLAVVSASMSLLLVPAVPALVGIGVWAAAGLAMGISYAPLSLTVLSVAIPGQEGAATAALQMSDTLGVALGTGAGGALVALGASAGWDERLGLLAVFVMSAAVALFGGAMAPRLPRRLPAETRATA